MSEFEHEQLTPYEMRLGRTLRTLSDSALSPVDASAIAHDAVTVAGPRRQWIALGSTFRPSVAFIVLLLTLALVAGAAFVGSRLLVQKPTDFRLGHLVYELDSDIWIADWDGSNAVKIADGDPGTAGIQYSNPHWSQDGSTLSMYRYDPPVADSEDGTLTIHQADRDGRGLHPVDLDESIGHYMSMSPTGAQRADYDAGGRLTIIDNGPSTFLIHPPAGFLKWSYWETPAWTPDGSRVIVSACTTSDCKSDSTHELFSVPISGAEPTRLTPAGTDDHSALVSPDGSLVSFLTNTWDGRLWRPALGLVGVDGSDRRLLPLSEGLSFGSMAWAPDSRSLAVATYEEEEATGISILSVDPAVPVRLLEGTTETWRVLDFSADGRWILATGSSEPAPGLWRVEVDGDQREELVAGSYGGDWQWLPNDASN